MRIQYNSTLPDDADPRELDGQAMLNLFNRGTLRDWLPVFRELRARPRGDVAELVARLIPRMEPTGVANLVYLVLAETRGEPVDDPVNRREPVEYVP